MLCFFHFSHVPSIEYFFGFFYRFVVPHVSSTITVIRPVCSASTTRNRGDSRLRRTRGGRGPGAVPGALTRGPTSAPTPRDGGHSSPRRTERLGRCVGPELPGGRSPGAPRPPRPPQCVDRARPIPGACRPVLRPVAGCVVSRQTQVPKVDLANPLLYDLRFLHYVYRFLSCPKLMTVFSGAAF